MTFANWSTDRSIVEICGALVVCAVCWTLATARYFSLPHDDRRGARLALFIRLLFPTTLLGLYLNPSFTGKIQEIRGFVAVVDESSSATRPFRSSNGDETTTARDQARSVARELDNIAELNDVHFSLRSLGDDPFESPITKETVYRDFGVDKFRSTLLLSDGVEHNDPPATIPEAFAPRVDSIIFGPRDEAFDWKLLDATLARDESNASFRLRATIRLDAPTDVPRSVIVRLLRRASDASEPTLARKETLELAPNGDATATLDWPIDEASPNAKFLLFVSDATDARFADDALPDVAALANRDDPNAEFNLADNGRAFDLAAPKKKLAVLLVDDEPRMEYRYLRETLRREENIDLKTILFAADPRTREADALALSPDDLSPDAFRQFDVVALGDVPKERRAALLQSLLDDDENAPSIWFLAPELDEDDRQIFRDARGDHSNAAESIDDSPRSLLPDPTARALVPALAELAPKALEITRLFPDVLLDPNERRLLLARAEDGSVETALALRFPKGRAVAVQRVDELWRLRTLEDKTVYRRAILEILDALVMETTKRRGNASPNDRRPTREPRDLFEYYGEGNNETRRRQIAEDARTAGALETAQALADASGGAVLDLRDLSKDEAIARATAFFRERADSSPVFETERSLEPFGRFGYYAALLCGLTFVALEIRGRKRS